MLAPSGDVRVMDFGVAKTEVSDLTITGVILGTPDYMSPEQAKGEALDGRSDIFSLGSVLYECLTGQQPFQSRNVTGVLLRIVNEPTPQVDWPSLDLPSGLEEVVTKALAKDPSQRYPSGAAFIEALEALVHGVEESPAVGIDREAHGDVPPSDGIESSPESRIEPAHLEALREEERPLVFTDSSQEILDTLDVGRDEAFIISRIDGQAKPGDVLSASPFPERDTARCLLSLIEIGLIKLRDEEKESTVSGAVFGGAVAEPESSAGHPIVQEIDEAYELSRSQDHAQILGVERSAGSKEIEQAFKEKFVRYSPDTYPQIEDPEFRKKLQHLLKLAYEAFVVLSKQAGGAPPPSVREEAAGKAATDFAEAPSLVDRERLSEEVFARAELAFLKQDYWETIQLCRHVIGISGGDARHHHLLGLALGQNVNWQEEAKEHLRRAAELDPENPEHTESLSKLYAEEIS
jgi:serine/threonine protein kinase